MSFWDYVMPHRYFINKSLRKEAEALRMQIDYYQIEYDRRVKACQEEIKETIKEKKENLERFRKSLIKELREEQKYLKFVAKDIKAYADAYLQRKCLYQMKNIKRMQKDILQEDKNFLNEQMRLIQEEIKLLKNRQNELSSFTRVEDFIQLALASGIELRFNLDDDAKTLLNKVSVAIEECDDSQRVERFALVRLKKIIQERAESLPIIKYITWVIKQKILLTKQLSKKRKDVKNNQEQIMQEIKNIENEISSVSDSLEELARRIRYYWAHPITNLNIDISDIYKRKEDIFDKLKSVGEELHNMASQHSNDQDKWELLQRKRYDLSNNIESLKDSIDSKKRERKQWCEKRNYIFQVCKKYDIFLIPENRVETDEKCIINERLSKLEKIRILGVKKAEKIYEQERAKLISNHDYSIGKQESELSVLEKQLNKIISKCKVAMSEVSLAKKKVKAIQDSDTRSRIVKIFSKTPGLEKAQKTLLLKKKTLENLKKKKTITKKAIDATKKKISELDKQHKKDLHQCKPKYLRPTIAELREEKKLLFQKEKIEKWQSENGYESKN